MVTPSSGRATFYGSLADDEIRGGKVLPILRRGRSAWNEWRKRNRKIRPMFSSLSVKALTDHSGYDFSYCGFVSAHFETNSFTRANLRNIDAKNAIFDHCDFREADLYNSNFFNCTFYCCKFYDSNLSNAFLVRTVFRHCNIIETQFDGAEFGETELICTSMYRNTGLSGAKHVMPSIIDLATLAKPLPLKFLRGIGLSEETIEGRKVLRNVKGKFNSCFISFSTKDQELADRLHRDLQNKGVRCWFAPHDLLIGAVMLDNIDEQISSLDKLLIVLSTNSIESQWVEDEVSKAFAEERRRKKAILLPIRIDDEIMKTREAWANKLRDQRNIGDFKNWRSRKKYNIALRRLLKSLAR